MIPPPPAPDAVLFRGSTGRVVACYAVLAVLGWLCAAGFYVGLAALLGWSVGRTVDFVILPQFVVPLVTVLGVLVGILIRSPHWVRLSAAGVEIGTTRARAVLIPWSGVESATVRGRSVFANLDVVPHPAAVAALQDAEGQLPRMRTRGGRRGYPVQVGLFPSGPAAVTAALRARGVPEVRRPAPTVAPR
ncbi:hypothetical protein Daura_31095 [Dactylosporangium aurantiacum]|uniref:PH domain-containing protein n=1 Tax=Dactylosporangium aurantiacum TaxID=35754 RepID=A0A9Q9I8P2_9ACTN|nr:hypothetical protein [Dactylosporangium aurantiacum]UWZ51196.1 hypothetical protein Daura_31095 [Dactylosporangium aurantiacum]